MSVHTKKQKHGTLNRAKAMHRIMKRIVRALGPFAPQEMLRFDGREFSTFRIEQDKHGRFTIKQAENAGFFERLYTELPRSLQRKFVLGGSLNASEYRKMEREILGHARQKLTRELVGRIKALPHLKGKGPKSDREEQLKIRNEVRTETRSGMSKSEAVRTVAQKRRLSERQIWRIIRSRETLKNRF